MFVGTVIRVFVISNMQQSTKKVGYLSLFTKIMFILKIHSIVVATGNACYFFVMSVFNIV